MNIDDQPPGQTAVRGAVMRTRREERGLSLRELGRRTQLSASMLSAIERGVTEPSISSLRRISEALGVSLFYLLEDGQPTEPSGVADRVVRPGTRRRVTLPQAGLRYELLCPDVSGRMEAWIATLAPGAATGEAARGHLSDEFMLVISGCAELEYGDERIELQADDSVYLDGTVAHRLRTVGDRPLVFLSVLSPPVL